MSLTRSVEKAREAFKKKDIGATIKAHSQKATERHKHGEGKYIKSIIYGGLDGIITTFAVVAGVAGASLAAGIVLILGFANLIADGLSMATGDYLSTKSEQEWHKAERKRETWEVENYPEGEKQEMVELYMQKGISKQDSKSMVSILAKNKQAWIDVMMVEELGILESNESPLKNGIATFLSFVIFGFVPLLAYVVAQMVPGIRAYTFEISIFLTALTLFTLGALKVKVTERGWFRSGAEMLIIGGIAASAAYGVGYLLAGLA